MRLARPVAHPEATGVAGANDNPAVPRVRADVLLVERGLAETRERAWPALDVSAGAVLLASVTASVIGLIIFLSRLVGSLSR